jgi:hypothetical protein
MLAGVITPEEYQTFISFQQHLNEDPSIKALNARISELSKELQQLHREAFAMREQLWAANPEIKAIREKIMTVNRPRGSFGPTPKPVPPAPSVAPVKNN